MSNVQLQVRPRRVRCSSASEPPPFRFDVASCASDAAAGSPPYVRLPLQAVAFALRTVGLAVDAAFFLVGLALWCGVHLALWSYAFQMGPAADCFGLPCHDWLSTKVIIGCVALATISFVAARILRRLGHRATAFVLLVLVTFDVSALLVLGIGSL